MSFLQNESFLDNGNLTGGDTLSDFKNHWHGVGQNQGGGWKQGREVGLAGVGEKGDKMQTTVIEQQ